METKTENFTPRVILSAGNIGHYHHAALALQQAGFLAEYFCVFSGVNDLKQIRKFLSKKDQSRLAGKTLKGLQEEKIHTIPFPYLITQAIRRAGIITSDTGNALFSSLFDRAVCHELSDADVFHFVSSVGLNSASIAKKRNMLVIDDVRSAHIDSEIGILSDEYKKLHLPFAYPNARFRSRVIAEYDLTDLLIVPSQFVARTMAEHGIAPSKIKVIPYGVDQNHIEPIVLNNMRNHIRENKLVFKLLFVGNVIPQKGLHYLIQCLEELQLPRCELDVVGRHPDIAYFSAILKMIKNLKVNFYDFIPHNNLRNFYFRADLFVFPSLCDSFGLVITEAMSNGLAVISSDNAGASELILNNKDGFVFHSGDYQTLKEKIEWCYQNRIECQEMGLHAASHVKEFTWEKYGEKIIDLYKNIDYMK